MNRAVSSRRIPLVDQLRGFAAASVAWFHLTNGLEGWGSWTGSGGWLGVEAFFVISGFVIPHSLSQVSPTYGVRDFPIFVARRVVRLEPPYLISIALVIGLNLLAASTPIFRGAPPAYHPMALLAHLFYLVPLTHYDWIQPVYWTLAYEFAFYLFIGLAYPLVSSKSRRWIGRACCALLLVLIATGAAPHLLALFVMGYAVHRRLDGIDSRAWTSWLISASVIALGFNHALDKAAVGAATALAILFHKSLPNITGHLGSALTGLGAISYSLYLLHVPIGGKVVNLGMRYVDGPIPELAVSLVAFAGSVAAATVFWYAIERPATAAARGLGIRTSSRNSNAAARRAKTP